MMSECKMYWPCDAFQLNNNADDHRIVRCLPIRNISLSLAFCRFLLFFRLWLRPDRVYTMLNYKIGISHWKAFVFFLLFWGIAKKYQAEHTHTDRTMLPFEMGLNLMKIDILRREHFLFFDRIFLRFLFSFLFYFANKWNNNIMYWNEKHKKKKNENRTQSIVIVCPCQWRWRPLHRPIQICILFDRIRFRFPQNIFFLLFFHFALHWPSVKLASYRYTT